VDIKQSQVDATFQFGFYGEPMTRPVHTGVFQLFEHRYNDKLVFWYGVADIACDRKDVSKMMNEGRLVVSVRIVDGREGWANIVLMESKFASARPEEATTYYGLMGATALGRRLTKAERLALWSQELRGPSTETAG
jgi:hypothetical protein